MTTMTKHPPCLLPDDFNIDNIGGYLNEMRRRIDDLWAMARDAVKAPEEQEWTDHERSMTTEIFELLQLILVAENEVQTVQAALHNARFAAQTEEFRATMARHGWVSRDAAIRAAKALAGVDVDVPKISEAAE